MRHIYLGPFRYDPLLCLLFAGPVVCNKNAVDSYAGPQFRKEYNKVHSSTLQKY